MSDHSRRSFLKTLGGAGAGIALSGSVASLLTSQASALAAPAPGGYGPLVPDPAGLVDLPAGFRYRVLSRAGLDRLDSGHLVPGGQDGMAAFGRPGGRTLLIRNHELTNAVTDPVPALPGLTYDPSQSGGTTNILVGPDGRVERSYVSLAGTIRNCAGGTTPWGTWITCEETDEIVGSGAGAIRHGYCFEVGANGSKGYPIRALGRFAHEAVCIDPGTGVVYLTEDASDPFGHVYRYQPRRPLGGRGSLHKGGTFQAMKVPGVTTDLSEIDEPGTTVEGIQWVDVPNRDPGTGAPVRTQTDATPIQKAEGTWWGTDGTAWIVSSFGRDTVKAHDGQVFRYDPVANTLTLVVQFGASDPFDGPDNITISPWGFAFLCEDGLGEQFVVGVEPQGGTFPFARNAFNGSELAGVCFSPDGRTMFFNVYSPGYTVAVTGPFQEARA